MKSRSRVPLSRERVLDAALRVADEGGGEALSMRNVAAALGVEAMSLYRYVRDKDDLVLGVADRIVAEIEVPPQGTPWREAMRCRAWSARAVFLRRPSAALLLESCSTMTPARLAYADAVVGRLMADGFGPTLAYRAFLLLDSYVYGFVMQELSWPSPPPGGSVPAQVEVPPERFPSFARVMTEVMASVGERGLAAAYAEEFGFGLELLLDALERRASLAGGPA